MKIQILTSNVQDIDTFQKGIALVESSLSTILPPQIAINTTGAVFTSVPFTNSIMSGYCIDQNQILSLIDGSDDIVFLIFDNTKVSPKAPLNPVCSFVKKGNTVPCQMCEQWYNVYPEVFAEFFLHELCHAMYFLTGQLGTDMTHLMVDRNMNPTLYDQFSRLPTTQYYLYVINSLLLAWNNYKSSITSQNVTLIRGNDNGKETLGTLSVGNFKCDTLERPWLNNQSNISCIPKGTYNCVWEYMGNLKEYHYQIQNVPNRSGIFIHELNYVSQSEGCVGLGSNELDINGDGLLDVTSSRVTLATFESLMNKKPFTITIK